MSCPIKLHTVILIASFVVVITPQSALQAKNYDIAYLEKLLANATTDTARANVLLKLGEAHCSMQNDISLMYLQEAFTLSTSEDYPLGIGRSLLWQGRVYYYKDDYPLAIKYLEKANVYLKKENDLNNLAFLNFVKGEIQRIRGDYTQAQQSYKEALRLAEITKNVRCSSTYYTSLGRVHIDRNEPEIAMVYFKEALKQKIIIDDQSGISNTITCIGMAFEKLDVLDSSLWYYNEALKIRTELKNERGVAGSEYSKAGILIRLQLYDEAEESLKIAIKIFTKLEEKTGILISKFKLALALNGQQNPGAVELAEEALQMAKSIDNPSLISHGYKILSDIYFFNKDFQSSYTFLEKHKSLDDSIFNTEKERILTEFEEKFQSDRKDREIEEYRSKSKIQKQNIILLIVILITAIGLLILLIFLFRLKSTALKRQEKLLEQEQVIHSQENRLIEKEKQLLQEQLESKNRELAAKALELIRLNDTISQIIEKLDFFKSSFDNPEASKQIKEIINDLENQTKQNIWNEFNQIFKNIHSDFYSKLLEICPDLTSTEIKTAALLKLNLTTKEIAALSFKSEGGVKTTRYRLRKKLNLSSDEKLIPFLMQI